MIRQLLAWLTDLKPRRCDLCGQRVPAACQDHHDALDHAGDPR